MNQIPIKILTVLILLALVGSSIFLIQDFKKQPIENKIKVSKYVTVDKSIIEGYEGQDYIPRSASINQRLRYGK